MNSISRSGIKVPAHCSEHTEQPIEYYCETDSQLICGHCAIMGSHKGHDIETLDAKVMLAQWYSSGHVCIRNTAAYMYVYQDINIEIWYIDFRNLIVFCYSFL